MTKGLRFPIAIALATSACSRTASEAIDASTSDATKDATTIDVADTLDVTDEGCGDTAGWCCCDIDVIEPPICVAGKLSCRPMYNLLFGSDCSTKCTLSWPDVGPG